MKFLSALKDAVFETDANVPASPQSTTVTPAAASPGPASPSNPQTYFPPSTPEADPAMLEMLRKVAYGRASSFKSILENMSKMESVIPDESTRAKAAFATMGGDTRTPQNVLQAIDVHIQDLDGEQIKFSNTSAARKTESLNAIATKLSGTENSIQRLLSELEALEQTKAQKLDQINQLNTNLASMQNDKAQIDFEFDKVASNFMVAFNVVKNELLSRKAIFQNIFK